MDVLDIACAWRFCDHWTREKSLPKALEMR